MFQLILVVIAIALTAAMVVASINYIPWWYKSAADTEQSMRSSMSRLEQTYDVVVRAAKVTPTKAGLFVTLWKRDDSGITRPYSVEDGVDEFWVVTETPNGYGYFAFTAQSLVDSGVLASSAKPGKRGFRLYTPWDTGLNASATKAWAWQRKFFTALER